MDKDKNKNVDKLVHVTTRFWDNFHQ